MKRIFLLLFFTVLVSSANLFSQSFTFERIDPAIVSMTIGDSSQQIKSHGVVRNLTGGNITINFQILNRYVSPGWDSIGMCTWNTCYAPSNYNINEICPPGVDTVYIYFTPYMHPGNGHCTVRATNGSTTYDRDFSVSADPIGIQQISSLVKDFSLSQNYPNPFNPSTKINFSIPKNEVVYLRVYDILGREVKTLIAEQLNAGEYQADFDAKNLSSGMYYYSLRAGDNVTVKKMVLVK